MIRTFICWYGSPDETPPDEVMARYDVVVGRACPPERRAALRRLNPGIRFVVYVNAIDCYLPRGVADVEFMDAGRVRPEHGGTSHAADIFANHRDFLLRTRAGARGAPGGPRASCAWGYQRPYDPASRYANRFFLDPRSAWKDYYPRLCVSSMTAGPYDGVFCDNAGSSIEWNFESLPDDLKADVTDAEWSRAVATMLSNVDRAVKAERPDALTFANTCGDFVRRESRDIAPTEFWRHASIDGAMDEFFAYSARPGRQAFLAEPRWREQLRSILCCEKLGCAYFAQSNGDELDHPGRIYSLASFLVGAGDRSLFNYNPAPAANYFLVYRLPEWDVDLGRPLVQYERLDDALEAGQGKVFARRFERGLVLVNPTDAPAQAIDLPPGSRRLVLSGGTLAHAGRVDWRPVSAPLTLAPHAAEILLRD